jgi:glyoxalase superfamily protein
MTMTLGPLVVDAVDPAAVERFWEAALGSEAANRLLRFRREHRPKVVKNRVHLDLYLRDVESMLNIGARVLAEHWAWVTLADIEGNEFCAAVDPALDDEPLARAFAICTDSDRPEELAAWWANLVGADVREGPDGTPRWLYGCAGWEGLIWKFVRVDDERVVPNRWQWTLRADPSELDVRRSPDGVLVDPQGNEFSVVPRTFPAG